MTQTKGKLISPLPAVVGDATGDTDNLFSRSKPSALVVFTAAAILALMLTLPGCEQSTSPSPPPVVRPTGRLPSPTALRRAGLIPYPSRPVPDIQPEIRIEAPASPGVMPGEFYPPASSSDLSTAEPSIEISAAVESPASSPLRPPASIPPPPAPKQPEGLEAKGCSKLAWSADVEIQTKDVTALGGSGKGITLTPRRPVAGGKPSDKIAIALAPPKNGNASGVLLSAHLFAKNNVTCTIAIESGTAATYYESVPVELKPGWNRDILFPLTKETWKSAASGWRHESTAPTSGIKRIIMLIYTVEPTTKITLDNVYIRTKNHPGKALHPAKNHEVRKD